MKKFGFASIIAGGLAAAVLGFAAPASAGVDHNTWLDQIGNGAGNTATAPHVDTSVHQSH
jgi:hypothetical protein